jgi:deoxyribonuclease-4
MLIVGAHISILDGFASAAEEAHKMGCNALQIFTKNPRGRGEKTLNPSDVRKFKEKCRSYGIKYVVAHSSYLLNFAKSMRENAWALSDIKLDFKRLAALGGQGVVVHIGKYLEMDKKKAIKNVIENTKRVIDETSAAPLEYILENTAGQGTELGYRLDELGVIWKGLKGFSPRLKSCLDTAHFWAAGYDIGTEKDVKKALKEYDEAVGLKTLSCFHFNDSKKPLGSRVDRHDNIGNGVIPKGGLAEIARFAESKSIPLILETPDKTGVARKKDIKIVKSFLAD